MLKIGLIVALCFAIIACGNPDEHHHHTSSEPIETTNPTMQSLMKSNMNNMMNVPATGNADKDFANLMKIHHQSAVEMSQLLLEKGEDENLKKLARKIIDEQVKEIAMFNNYLTSAPVRESNSDSFYKESMSQMHKTEMKNDSTLSIDQQFVHLMIIHHQGGIDMANLYLDSGGKDQGLRTMAGKIIQDQRNEIIEMQEWLDKRKS